MRTVNISDLKARHLLGIEAAEQGRFPQLLIGGQRNAPLRHVFAPLQRRPLKRVGGPQA